jgi:polysaccharide chain length determinant protein (PEP-CTERM system associated)
MVIDILNQLRTRSRAIWRRRWIAITTAWALMLLGTLVVTLLPNQYESSSRIYVDTDSLMGPLLKGIAVQDDLTQQLSVMQNTLLSRPNLLKVARSVDLDLDVNNARDLEKLTERLMERTKVSVSGPKLFTVTHQDTQPRRARDIVQAFLTIFVENNLGKDRSDMENARAFIAKQIEGYQEQLRETEKRMAEFRAKHSDIVSPSGSSFSIRLEQVREAVDDAKFKLGEARDRRDRIANQLESTPQLIEVNSAQASTSDPALARLAQVKTELNQKLVNYTVQHPDVVALKKELEGLERRYSAGPNGKSEVPNPLYDEMKLRLLDAEAELSNSQRRLALTDDAYQRLQAVASSAPRLEAEMADMNRDYEILKKKYEELRIRSESARISQDARTNTEAVRFRIVDPPEVSAIPSGPNRLLYLVAVLLASIGGGIGFAFILSEVDDTFSTPQGLREMFNLPVLGSVCFVPSRLDTMKQSLDKVSVSAAVGALIVFFFGVVMLTTDLIASPVNMGPLREWAQGIIGT